MGNRNREEYLKWKKAYWIQFLESLSLPEIEGRVLDAGCGPAGIFMALDGAEVTAIDPLLGKYRQNLDLPPSHFEKIITFKELGIEDYYMIEHFDFIFCLNAINHVNDFKKSIHNLSESLQPGGKIIMSIDCHNFTFFQGLFKLLPLDILHPHQYNLKEYIEHLRAEGLRTERTILIKKGFIFNYYALVGRRI